MTPLEIHAQWLLDGGLDPTRRGSNWVEAWALARAWAEAQRADAIVDAEFEDDVPRGWPVNTDFE